MPVRTYGPNGRRREQILLSKFSRSRADKGRRTPLPPITPSAASSAPLLASGGDAWPRDPGTPAVCWMEVAAVPATWTGGSSYGGSVSMSILEDGFLSAGPSYIFIRLGNIRVE